jgi:hypothetical protein
MNNKFLLILFIATGLIGSFAQAEDIRLEFLDTDEEIHKEMCRVHGEPIENDCGYPGRRKFINMYLPASLSKIILSHINKAKKSGYFVDFSYEDFFHGHFIVGGPRITFSSPEDFFSDIKLMLYHSAEFNNRWLGEARQGIPVEKRTPRSFIGWLDGSEEKAIDYVMRGVPNTLIPFYEPAGTINSDYLVAAHPELSTHKEILATYVSAGFSLTACKGTDCRVCHPFGEFYILEEPTGRFTTDDGKKIELYLRCIVD